MTGKLSQRADPLFVDAQQPFPNDSSIAVALGDLDGDGDLDAYVSNRVEAAPMFDRIYINDGHGRLIDSGQQIDVDNAQIALADLDGDGDLDAFAATNQPPGIPVAGDENLVLINQGDGRLIDSGQHLGRDESARVVLSDVDNDGTVDAVIGNLGGDHSVDRPGNQVYLNDGDGNFLDSGQRLGAHGSRGVAVGDLDGNGTPDMFVADDDASRVYLNDDGDGLFTDSGQVLGNGIGFDLALADFDRDGDLDAYVAKAGADEVWHNNGLGKFSLANLHDIPSSINVELGDLDNDGWIDAFVVSNSGPDRLLFNDGSGLLVHSDQLAGYSGGSGLGLGDLDGDGDLDAFVANNGLPVGAQNAVFLNQTAMPTDTVIVGAETRVADGLRGVEHGLVGTFYDRDDPVFAIDSLAFADQVIASQAPSAQFEAHVLDYPAGGEDILFLPVVDDYLGQDGNRLDPASLGITSTSPSVWRFSGFIQIDPDHDTIGGNDTIDVAFGLGSDDGSRLRIGGTDIVTIDTFATVTFPGVSGTASFEQPGLYPIEIVHYDHFGGIGLEVSTSMPGGRNVGGPGDTLGVLPTANLFQAVEPDIAAPLPLLVEKHTLSETAINGVDATRFTIGESGDARITFHAENGAFNSALGAYLIDDQDMIIDPSLVFESMVSDAVGTTIATGETVHLSDLFDADTLLQGTHFGLFLIADGANGNLPGLMDGELAFRTGHAPAKVTDRVPELVHIDTDGNVTSIEGHVMHTVDAGSPNPASNTLNEGKTAQAVSGVRDGQYIVAFEDKPLESSGSDGDFNDVLVVVDNGSLPTSNLEMLIMPAVDIT